MFMQTLVVIPSLMHKYSFSAPLAWLFSDHVDRVKGMYSFALTKDIVKQYSRFIVELNWFIELYEFELIARFIKQHNPRAVILFGGSHSQIKYREIFQHAPVDYFIKGDNEVPLKQFLDGVDPRTIPNMVGRDFENEQTYVFRQSDFQALEFSLAWFPEYEERWQEYPDPDADTDAVFSELPLYPKYWQKPGKDLPLTLQWRIPSKGGRYHLPMLFTARGGCPVAHTGCEYCMGSKTEELASMYKRPPVVMDNETLIHLLKKIEKSFKQVSIYINTDCVYDFTGHHFDLEATIEIDSPSTIDDVGKILPAFRKANLHTALYKEGLVGTDIRTNFEEYRALEDERHKVYFFAYPDDALAHNLPNDRRLYSELILPYWTDWNFYTDRSKAFAKSRSWYMLTGQTNLYPLPRRIGMRIARSLVLPVMYALNKSGIVNLKKQFID
jgi:hypothetical protein